MYNYTCTLFPGDEVKIKWKKENDNSQHTGYLSLQWLMANTYTVQSLEQRSTDLEPIPAVCSVLIMCLNSTCIIILIILFVDKITFCGIHICDGF